MNFELTHEQKRIQAQARQFAEQEVAPVAREADEKGQFPLHLVKRMGELGFLAGPIEPEFGGSGMDYLSYALLCEELGRVDSSVRGFLTVHTSLVSLCIRDWGTEEQSAATFRAWRRVNGLAAMLLPNQMPVPMPPVCRPPPGKREIAMS